MQRARRNIIRFGVFELDSRTGELRKLGVRVKLAGQAFQVLQLLLEQPGELVTRDELRQRLWPSDTFVDFEHSLNATINRVREILGDSADNPRFIETMPRRGYRFIAPVDGHDDEANIPNSPGNRRPYSSQRWPLIAVVALVAILIGAGFLILPRSPVLTDKDTILLTDFVNRTSDPAFDTTLKTGLAIDLDQSPYLKVFPDQDVRQTLQLMARLPDAPVTNEVGREICRRAGIKAMLTGSIANVGSEYVITLEAVNASNGESLARQQVEANRKEEVLNALHKAGSRLRRKLGESIVSVERYDKPLEEATTSSLDALKAYTEARKVQSEKGEAEAIPLARRAIELDPNFALAYVDLGIFYSNSQNPPLAIENLRKAYELRERVGEREKFYISASYYFSVTGELEKAVQEYELWLKEYPRDAEAHSDLGFTYNSLGQNEKAVVEAGEAIALEPDGGVTYSNLAGSYIGLNRLDEAKATAEQALARKLDYFGLHDVLYTLSFFQNDTAGMQQQLAWAMGKPEAEDTALFYEKASTEAYHGRLRNARTFAREAMESAKRHDARERAALYQAITAVLEADCGNPAQARQGAKAALALASGRHVKVMAAMALSATGDVGEAQKLVEELSRDFPLDTLMQHNAIPSIRAHIELTRGEAAKAIEILQTASPLELSRWGMLGPVYVRGLAYLRTGNGTAAAGEFQKMLDHRAMLGNSSRAAHAHLGLARAHALSGDTATARTKYQDFLTLWKDADPDIPILKQAKAEYAKLQ